MNSRQSPLLQHVIEIEKLTKDHEITISDIVKVFGDEGHFVLILFLIIPFLQPIPLFGLSTPFGILISIVAIFSYLKKPPAVPQRWGQKKLSQKTVLKIAEGSENFFKKLEKVIKPRGALFFTEPFRTINICIIVANAIFLALPLPIPFSNMVPAWGILFQAIANLERDGILIAVSYVQMLLCLAFFGLLAYGVVLI